MKKTNEEMNATAHYMIGNWTCKVNNANLTIKITEKEVKLLGTVKEEDVSTTFDNATWWVGEYLCFTSDQRFYIHYANEKELAFGELLNPGVVGGIKWSAILTRDLKI